MPEEHPVGGGKRQRVTGAFLPGQVLRARHELLRLHGGELGKRAVRRLVAPDPLAGREHRVAAVAFLVVAVVLVAMDHDLVADLPARDLFAHRPDDARSVGPGDVIGRLVHVEGADRDAEAGPDAVVIHARGHHQHDDLVAVGRLHVDDFQLERLVRLSMPLAPDRPGVHLRGKMTQRGELPDLVQVLLAVHRDRLVQAHDCPLITCCIAESYKWGSRE